MLPNGTVTSYYRDSIPVIDGDIILTKKQVDFLRESCSAVVKSAIITGPGNFWFNGIVYYNVADDFVNPSDVYSAMNVIMSRVPTMTTKRGNAFWGNYNLSAGDIKALKVIYGNANTPFYVGLVEDKNVIRDVVDQNYDYYEYESTNKLVFYKDVQCTQPYSLENDRLVQIGFYRYESREDCTYTVHNVMLTAGTSECQLVNTGLIDENYQGNSIQYKGTSYYLFKEQW